MNQIKSNAAEFVKEWSNEARERSESQSFWNDFFNVFGISRRRVASFEEPVKRLGNKQGFIDLFWKGTLIVEHKSKGNDLDKAYTQAIDYFPNLREEDLPRYILVSDFAKFKLYDLERSQEYQFNIDQLPEYIEIFNFISGRGKSIYSPQDPVNIEAAELMGELHDKLANNGYSGHELEIFLVRILFCLFAEDTGIFEPKGLFYNYINNRTCEDGSDVGARIIELFQVLDQPIDKRYKNLDEDLKQFPYVNGSLFTESIHIPAFDTKLRTLILKASLFDWSKISPAIFGSLFQSVMNPELRRNLGAHYTSEKNILRVIKPLFLDALWDEFYSIQLAKQKKQGKLEDFHNKLAKLKFLDPACGCGNFLIITYRELRILEIAILKEINQANRILDIRLMAKLDVDQMYGIEIEEWPAKVAEVALWLIDHQMNIKLGQEFGEYFARLPLNKAAKIIHGNALQVNWEQVVPSTELSYILGNPPFIGSQSKNKEQDKSMSDVMVGVGQSGLLDFVAAWYILAAKYIKGTRIKVAFVSTNSICQGQQVGILWSELMSKYHISIHFAHQTFHWSNEAKNNAAVHVVIIGFANHNTNNKIIFEYDDIKGEPFEIKAKNINPYLIDGCDLIIKNRIRPICNVNKIINGSMPNDGGYLIIEDSQLEDYIKQEPNVERYIKPLISAEEFIHGIKRWCLWLVDVPPYEFRNMPLTIRRIEKVKEKRLSSSRAETRALANTPYLFGEVRQPKNDYVLIPRHSSESRKYIPIGMFSKDEIVSDSCVAVLDSTLFHFGVLTSYMHMVWVKFVCGRIKSDYRYSNRVVYNNFPWPTDISDKQKSIIEQKAKVILDTRAKYQDSSLADLYASLTMPPDLFKAHQDLDKAVEKAYRKEPFLDDNDRIEFLFSLYGELAI